MREQWNKKKGSRSDSRNFSKVKALIIVLKRSEHLLYAAIFQL